MRCGIEWYQIYYHTYSIHSLTHLQSHNISIVRHERILFPILGRPELFRFNSTRLECRVNVIVACLNLHCILLWRNNSVLISPALIFWRKKFPQRMRRIEIEHSSNRKSSRLYRNSKKASRKIFTNEFYLKWKRVTENMCTFSWLQIIQKLFVEKFDFFSSQNTSKFDPFVSSVLHYFINVLNVKSTKNWKCISVFWEIAS